MKSLKSTIRLHAINQMISGQYSHIWDCCCDHGLLGLALLQRNAASKIHFVDILEPLVSRLETKLQQYFSGTEYLEHWQTHCMDVADINLHSNLPTPPENHDTTLVIIAGVGGDRTIDFIQAIASKNRLDNIEFILCLVHHNYRVRKALAALNFGLIDEQLVCENKRFYEIIHASTRSTQPLSVVGSTMWDYSRDADRKYLAQVINHYQRQSKDPGKQVSEILTHYLQLKNNLLLKC